MKVCFAYANHCLHVCQLKIDKYMKTVGIAYVLHWQNVGKVEIHRERDNENQLMYENTR